MKRFIYNGMMITIILSLFVVFYSCKDSTTNPVSVTYDANSINGTITFVDTANFVSDTTNGTYYVAVFSAWPGPPAAVTKIFPIKSGNTYSASYKVLVSANGNYVVSTAWVKKSPYASLILGVYDVAPNDTSRATLLGAHPTANIVSNQGVGNINYRSYIDTTKKLAKF